MKKYTILETQYPGIAHMPLLEILKHDIWFANALFSLPRFKRWFVERKLADYDSDLSQFCCVEFALWNLEYLRENKEDDVQKNPHRFILYWEHTQSYGIQHSSCEFNLNLNYCPWCGPKLPEYQNPYRPIIKNMLSPKL